MWMLHSSKLMCRVYVIKRKPWSGKLYVLQMPGLNPMCFETWSATVRQYAAIVNLLSKC